MSLRADFLNSNGEVDCTETTTSIYGLFGKYRPLSNFHMEDLVVDEIIYRCSEAAYMAQKTDNYDHKKYLGTLIASEAKEFGQTVVLRQGWDSIKVLAMNKVLLAKFSQSKSLERLLASTGSKYIEETNWWNDTFWGVCDLVGQNNLGKLLMEIRAYNV